MALGYPHKFRPATGTIYTHPLGVRTKMPPSREAIPAVSTGNVSLAHDEIPARKSFHVFTDSVNDTGKLVTDGHRHWNGFLRPFIPVVDMHVGATDRRLQHPDQHLVTADFWDRNILEPKASLCFCFNNSLHGLHDMTLGQSEKHEKVFAASNGCMENHMSPCFLF